METLRKWRSTVARLTLLALLIGVNAIAQTDRPIRIAENDWTGQLIDINLAKILIEEHLDQKVELVFADYTGQWTGLAVGDLDVAMEIWPSFSFSAKEEFVDQKKQVEMIGELGVEGTSGWYVPTYVIKGDAERGIEPMAPNLKSYKELNQYAHLFTRVESDDKAFCLDAVVTWEAHNKERIESLGLNAVNVFAGTEGALLAELKSAYEKGEPLLLCDMWSPHWAHAVYDLTEIELPPYSEECFGIGSDEVGSYACDWPVEALYNVARVGFKDEFPKAYAFLKKMRLSTADQAKMLERVDVDGLSVEEAVREWLAENETTWKAWLP